MKSSHGGEYSLREGGRRDFGVLFEKGLIVRGVRNAHGALLSTSHVTTGKVRALIRWATCLDTTRLFLEYMQF